MGPAGPNTIAWRWLTLILEDGDLRQAWPLTAPHLRRTLARAWVEANPDHPALVGRDPDELTQELAAAIPTDPLWPAFEGTQLHEFQEVWSWVDLSTYGTASDPRPAGPNEEGVVLVDTTAPGLVERPDGTLEVVGEVGDDVPPPGKDAVDALLRRAARSRRHGQGRRRREWLASSGAPAQRTGRRLSFSGASA